MKKILLAAFVAVASLSANAQVWVGGELGMNTSKTTEDGTTLSKDKDFTFAPEIGYKFSDKIDFAIAFNFTHEDEEYKDYNWETEQYGTYVDSYNSFSFNPYVRYTAIKSGKFSAFVDGGFYYGFRHVCGDDENTINWGITIRPGFAYALTEKVGLVAHVGRIGWDFSKYDERKTNDFGLNLYNNISFGAYVSF